MEVHQGKFMKYSDEFKFIKEMIFLLFFHGWSVIQKIYFCIKYHANIMGRHQENIIGEFSTEEWMKPFVGKFWTKFHV
jgi:hypothetical protein